MRTVSVHPLLAIALLTTLVSCDYSERISTLESALDEQRTSMDELSSLAASHEELVTRVNELKGAIAELEKGTAALPGLSVDVAQLRKMATDLETRLKAQEERMERGRFGSLRAREIGLVDASDNVIGRMGTSEDGSPGLFLGPAGSDSYALVYFQSGSPAIELSRDAGLAKFIVTDTGSNAFLNYSDEATIHMSVVHSPGTAASEGLPAVDGYTTARFDMTGGTQSSPSKSKLFLPGNLRLTVADSFGPSVVMSNARMVDTDNWLMRIGSHLSLSVGTDGPSVSLADEEMNTRAVLGATTITEPSRGGQWKDKKRSPASLLFFNKEGKVTKNLGR